MMNDDGELMDKTRMGVYDKVVVCFPLVRSGEKNGKNTVFWGEIVKA